MHLLFFTSEPCPTFRADVAGLFGKHLPNYGVFSDVVAIKAPGHEGPVAWGGGKALVCSTAANSPLKHVRKFLHCAKHLFLARKPTYQAVQVRDMPYLAVFCLLIARFKGLPFFYWMSYPIPEGQMARARGRGLRSPGACILWLRGRIGKILLYRLVLPHADHIFVQSEQMKRDVVTLSVPSERITPVPMGVDLEGVRSLEIKPSNDSRLRGRQALVYLGTLDRPRHIEILFDMLAQVRREIPQALLVLIGDTHDLDHRGWLRVKAQQAGVEEHILWTGWLAVNDAWGYVLFGRVGLSPIPRGALLDCASPTKVPEYLSLGVPVVCNDNPDQQAIIEASGAGLCVPYSGDDFAQAVIALLKEDDSLRAQRIRRGYEYVNSNRDYRIIAKQVADVYFSLCPSAAN